VTAPRRRPRHLPRRLALSPRLPRPAPAPHPSPPIASPPSLPFHPRPAVRRVDRLAAPHSTRRRRPFPPPRQKHRSLSFAPRSAGFLRRVVSAYLPYPSPHSPLSLSLSHGRTSPLFVSFSCIRRRKQRVAKTPDPHFLILQRESESESEEGNGAARCRRRRRRLHGARSSPHALVSPSLCL